MGNEPRPRKAKNSTSMAEREQRVDNNTSLTAPSLSVCAYDSDTCAFFFLSFSSLWPVAMHPRTC